MTEIPRNLAYWKQRQVDLRNCIAMTKPNSYYWSELWWDYRYAEAKVEAIEARVLVKHLISHK